jgi:steroid delta-isomerase-like uncharacterized protein
VTSPTSLDEVGLPARWRRAWASGDRESFAACCSAGVSYEDPVTPEPIDGLDAIAQHAARYRDAFPDLRVEPMGQALAEGGFACVPWRLVGTHRGAFAGVPASGRFVVIQGLHYLELTDDRVRRARGFFDLYDVGVQLGLLPARGSLAETALLLIRGFGLRPRA